MGTGTGRSGTIRTSRSALLAAPFPPRSRPAKPGERWDFARHIFAEITSAAKPDRHRNCSSCRYRGRDRNGAGARLLRRHTIARSQTRSRTVHAHRPASTGGFPGGRSLIYSRVSAIAAAPRPVSDQIGTEQYVGVLAQDADKGLCDQPPCALVAIMVRHQRKAQALFDDHAAR